MAAPVVRELGNIAGKLTTSSPGLPALQPSPSPPPHPRRAALYLQSSATGIPHAFVIGTDSTILWAGHPMDPGFEASLARTSSSQT